MVMEGSLDTLPLSSVFQFVQTRGGEGTIAIYVNNTNTFIHINEGNITAIGTSYDVDYRLGDYLIKNMLAVREMVKGIEAECEVSGKRSEVELISRGIASRGLLSAAVRVWIEETLFNLARKKKGKFRYVPGFARESRVDPVQQTVEIIIPINNFLLEMARRDSFWKKVETVFPNKDKIFELKDVDPKSMEQSILPDLWREEVRLLNGTRSLADVEKETILTEYELYQVLLELYDGRDLVNVSHETLIELADASVERGDFEAARKYFQNVLEVAGGDMVFRERYAAGLIKMDQDEDAYEEYKLLGQHHEMMEDYEKAMECYTVARELRPDLTEITLLIADAYELSGQVEKALEERARFADFLFDNGDVKDAAYVFLYLMEVQPENLDWYYRAAKCYSDMDMPETATDIYEKAIGRLIAEGKKKDVQEVLNHALKFFPTNSSMERKLLKTVREAGKDKKSKDESGIEKLLEDSDEDDDDTKVE